ncbi:hypothetical protein OHA25_39025 [Nonomuraea sp. NBC_00507]|uniref:hypothetical protein n=1 Tax=Nonomuraea sp. NBC_00507 TaxID=2976002 RepID=UPI002E187B49
MRLCVTSPGQEVARVRRGRPGSVPDSASGATSAAGVGPAVERFLDSITAATTRTGYAEALTRLTIVTGPAHPVAALAPEHYAAVMDRRKSAAAAT